MIEQELLLLPSLRQSVQEVLDKALHGIETSNYELEFETKSNEIRCLLVNVTTCQDPENNIIGVVGVAQDMTDSKLSMARELRQLVDIANAMGIFNPLRKNVPNQNFLLANEKKRE